MIVTGELKGGAAENNNIDMELNYENMINSKSQGCHMIQKFII